MKQIIFLNEMVLARQMLPHWSPKLECFHALIHSEENLILELTVKHPWFFNALGENLA